MLSTWACLQGCFCSLKFVSYSPSQQIQLQDIKNLAVKMVGMLKPKRETKANETKMELDLLCRAVGLHQVTDLHFVSPAFSRAWNISGHERLGFMTARLDSFKALGPRPVVNERTSIDFSWNGIKPFRHAMKHLSKAYELEPGIYQACVILYVEIRQQLCFHMALARNQERLGDFTDFLMERSWRKYIYNTL